MSELEELQKLQLKRNIIFASLTRFERFIAQMSVVTAPDLGQIRVRLEKIEPLYTEFDAIQSEIEIILMNSDSLSVAEREPTVRAGESSQAGETTLDHRTDFEELYFKLISQARNFLRQDDFISAASAKSPYQNEKIKLPDLVLPEFDGKYEDFRSFLEEFTSIIDSRHDLAPVQKFRYLKRALKGDAAAVLKGMEVTNDTYNYALETLKDRFDNKRRVISKHLKAILDCEKVEKPTPAKLQNIIDVVSTNLRCLKALGLPTDHWDAIVVQILVRKLDSFSRQKWEQIGNKTSLPTLKEFLELVQERANVLETLDEEKGSKTTGPRILVAHAQGSEKSEKTIKCSFCGKNHRIYFCKNFKSLSVYNRRSEVSKLGLCEMCLISHKDGSKCAHYHCFICGKPHNKMLHLDEEPEDEVSSHVEGTITASSMEACADPPRSCRPKVLLSTAVVHIVRSDGTILPCRALLDSASQSNFLSTRLANKLLVPQRPSTVKISGIGGQLATSIPFTTNCLIKSRYEPFEINLECLVIPKITLPIPESLIDISKWDIPSGVFLADPDFTKPQNIDMLIGAELFFSIMKANQISLGENMPKMHLTSFGWVIGGKIGRNQRDDQEITSVNTCVMLDEALKKFWDLEEGFLQPRLSKEEKECEKLFIETTKRDPNGRFIVRLPKNGKVHSLGKSRETALKRFLNLERRLKNNPELKASYSAFMREYESLGHMEVVSGVHTVSPIYYLPHHCVTNDNSSTTKLRVVFDGSAKTSTGISLNDALMTGPTIQEDLLSIILRFRNFNYVITSDITKMYRQILVHKSDRHLQRILWRDSPDEPIRDYCLKTVTYGTSPASFLATRCTKQAANEMSSQYPNSATAICQNLYVDDFLGGHDDLNELIKIKNGVIQILQGAGMELHKWCSNNPKLLEDIPREKREAKYIPDEKTACIKTLGLWWNPSEDIFKYSVNFRLEEDQLTKRQIASVAARIFDPLGLIGPVIAKAKMFLQALWHTQLEWDDELPLPLLQEWNHFRSDLPRLESLCVPRQALKNSGARLELHGFADASERAYGAAIYVRTILGGSNSECNLLISKSRVAPMKKQSIPRLELCGALLLAKLCFKVKQSIQIEFSNVFLWTDSTIVLSWLKAPSARWKTFVANRVSEIQELTIGCTWMHVNSEDNPADMISRGLIASEIVGNSLWWNGPLWLNNIKDEWPHQPADLEIEEEKRTIGLVSIVPKAGAIIEWARFSSFSKLLRVMIYIKRFCKLRLGMIGSFPQAFSPEEFEDAELTIIRMLQIQCFDEEWKQLVKNGAVHPRSKISALCPFLDAKGLVRVGGRIQQSELPYNQKHQYLLPKHHHVTKLIIRDEHRRACHAGPQLTLATVRQRFWPLDARNTIRSVTRHCITCYRNIPKTGTQQMGNLPVERLVTTRAFWKTGVDYCGPIQIKSGSTRNARPRKAYIAVFICMAVKAIHLELVSDLTAEAFIAALKRFTSRRGKPTLLVSDNGRNFTGAKRELHAQLLKIAKDPKLASYLLPEKLEWKFIPPYSPEFGGLWESAVKAFKHHFKRICGQSIYTFEETYTYMTMVESCLNSRPLTPMSDDPNDLMALTPGHFLIGDAMSTLPVSDIRDSNLLALPRWHRIQQMFQTFWTRFSNEYLTNLQPRSKNVNKGPNLRPGQLVLLKSEDLPPLKWPLGRVISIHPGSDGLTRVATVKTQSGTFRRSLSKICPLPLEDEDEDH